MTARTLEEIEALAAEATPGPWERLDCGLIDGNGTTICSMFGRDDNDFHNADKNGMLIAELPRLLAIVQEQRAEIARLRNELEEANECRDPAYFAQLGRKRKR